MQHDHAIVMGGGFAGLIITHLVAQHFNKVTLIERDTLTMESSRPGIPQASHLHVLMQQGQVILETLMPGVLSNLPRESVEEIDWAKDTKWYGPFGAYPQYDSPIKTLSFSRHLLDRLLLKRILALDNVATLKGTVNRLVGNNNQVYAVEMQDDASAITTIKGELIVDARGRNSNATDMLNSLGYTVPTSWFVGNDLGYASRVYKKIEPNQSTFKQIYLQVRPRLNTRGVVVSPIENNEVIVTALGYSQDQPPRQETAFNQFLNQLHCDELQDFLSTLTPISRVTIYRNLHNQYHQYGKMKAWPSGFIVIGDAVCRMNPAYGQGMTLALKQIVALKEKLDELKIHEQKSWEKSMQKSIDKINWVPWMIATSEDQRALAHEKLPLYMRGLHFYFDHILKLAVKHKKIHILFIKILHMMKSPVALLHPAVLFQLLYNLTFNRET